MPAEPLIKWLDNIHLNKAHLVEMQEFDSRSGKPKDQDEMIKAVIRRNAISAAAVSLFFIIRTARESSRWICSELNLDSLPLAFSCGSCPCILFSNTQRILFVSVLGAILLCGWLRLLVSSGSAIAKEPLNTAQSTSALNRVSTRTNFALNLVCRKSSFLRPIAAGAALLAPRNHRR